MSSLVHATPAARTVPGSSKDGGRPRQCAPAASDEDGSGVAPGTVSDEDGTGVDGGVDGVGEEEQPPSRPARTPAPIAPAADLLHPPRMPSP